MKFQKFDIRDKEWITERLSKVGYLSSDLNFTTWFYLRDLYNLEVLDYEGFLCIKADSGEKTEYTFPIGNGDRKKVFDAIREDAFQSRVPFLIHGILDEQKIWIEEEYPGEFEFEYVRDICEYIYNTERLIHMPGRKLQDKRRLITRFKEAPDWSYEKITRENIDDCNEMHNQWCQLNYHKENSYLQEEGMVVKLLLEHYEELGLTGGLIRKAGSVIAFSLGEPLANNRAYVIHVEKAYGDIKGGYPMINQQVAMQEGFPYKYINRVSDMGEEGLRRAKMQYSPDILLNRYHARAKETTWKRLKRKYFF